MKKAALLGWLLFSTLFACDAGFQSCLQKVAALHVVSSSSLAIPLDGGKTLLYSDFPVQNALKSDPFLHLYLVKTKAEVRHPFKINKYLPNKELASIREHIVCGKVVQPQIGLERFARFSKPLAKPSVILNGCCELVALNTTKGIIQKPYIEHFLRKGGVYGDLGIRLEDSKKELVVASCNPFVETPFKVGDRIIVLNGKRVHSKAEFARQILFAPIGSKCSVKVVRNDKKLTLKATLYKRRGGGYLSDTFLESVGVFVDERLQVVASSFEKIHKGDRIIMINGQKVLSQKDVREALSKVGTKEFLIGLNRKGLDIFILITF